MPTTVWLWIKLTAMSFLDIPYYQKPDRPYHFIIVEIIDFFYLLIFRLSFVYLSFIFQFWHGFQLHYFALSNTLPLSSMQSHSAISLSYKQGTHDFIIKPFFTVDRFFVELHSSISIQGTLKNIAQDISIIIIQSVLIVHAFQFWFVYKAP